MTELAQFLGEHVPFDALCEEDLQRIAEAARVVDYPAGAEIIDAFLTVGDELSVVLAGQVELWAVQGTYEGPADEVLGRGAVFGHSSVLSGVAIGPRVAALGPVRLVQIPKDVVATAFSSPAGVRFLAREMGDLSVRSHPRPAFHTVDELIVSKPVLGDMRMTVGEAARVMSERSSSYIAFPCPAGEYGLITDAVLREQVVAAGLPAATPVQKVMVRPAVTAVTGTPTVDVLRDMAAHRVDHLLVTDPAGTLRGAIDPQDFLASSSAAVMLLRNRIEQAGDVEHVVTLARRLPALLGELVRQRKEASEATAVYSTVVDAIQRQALKFVLREHAELDEAEVTWIVLGSNARREPMLGSDIDSAVVFAESVNTPERAAAYRTAFAEVADVMRRAGLQVDQHGATPSNATFARTRSAWRRTAQEWLENPLDNQGMLMASLLLDGRPIQGDPAWPVVNEVFADVRDQPGTMRLLVRESLSHRARLRSVRDVLTGRGDTFDLKAHALRPVVEMARWAALAVKSAELSTKARLAAASGSTLLPAAQGASLIEVFEVLQRVRMRQQLAQFERGDRVSDVVWMPHLSPLERSLVAQSVREISTVQKRLFNMLQYTAPSEWGELPDT